MSHNETQFDPNEQLNMRYRLFARAIRINGLSQLDNLQPYLQARLQKTLDEKISPQILVDGSEYTVGSHIEGSLTDFRLEFRPHSAYHARFCDRDVGSLLLWRKAM